MKLTRRLAATTALLAACLLASCSPAATNPSSNNSPGGLSTGKLTEAKELTVITHDSFALSDELKQKFETQTGYKVTYLAPGDGGSMVNQLVLTKDSPLGDVAFGIDNTLATRALQQGVISAYDSPALPASAKPMAISGLTPIDFSDVCLNADKAWFKAKSLPIPASLDELTKPEYKDLLVISNPASSSPGLAFLIATIGAKGEAGYLDYWDKLKANGLKVVPSWTNAYYTEFSAADGKGPRPLVLSYATSPAFTLSADKQSSTTVALLGSCLRQVEYAGVLKGAKNEVGARKFIDFLLSAEVQASIPGKMYMYPVNPEAKLPAAWVKFAPLAKTPIQVPAEQISANRDRWIKDWTQRVIG